MSATFKRNLFVGFGLSLSILVISSVASFVSIRSLIDSAQLVDHTNLVIQKLETTLSTLKDAETGQRGFLLTGKNEYLEPYTGARNKALQTIQEVRTLTIDNPPQTKSCDDLKLIVAQKMSVLQDNIDFAIRNHATDPLSLEKGRQFMDEARNIVAVMEQREKDLLAARTTSMNKFSLYTPVLIIIAAILALIITIFFYVRVRNDFEQRLKLQKELQVKDEDITRRINIIQGIAEKISAGNYAIRVQDEGSDGLGGLADSLNTMASSLAYSFNLLSDKEWLQAGIVTLNDIMIGDKVIETLTKDILQVMATYVNANVGAFYIKENAEWLHFYNGFAFNAAEERQRVKIGEGIIGQSVASGKMVTIEEVPQDSIMINYAAGSIQPRQVVAFPVFDGLTIKGAIELGTLKPFREQELEFLRSAAHNIGIAISSCQSRKKMQELLEETQSQAEELQAQHSELEGLNTEMEMQNQKLQSSEEELRVQQEELLQANQELEERSRLVEEKNQLIVERNIQIQQKAEELEQSTKYKSEFLANMSHELRTPLNSILLLSRLLSENNDSNLSSDQVEYANVIQSSGKGLLSLIDEILDLSKIEAGKMALEYEMVPLQEIANDMSHLFSAIAKEKNLELHINIEQGLPGTIETDKLRVEQVTRNLLSNALKFTSRGYVAFNIHSIPGQRQYIGFTVKDTGIGIPPEKQRLIFEAFQQADGSTRRRYGGTGLGLSISRELARLLNGHIDLRSEPGEGSEFTLYIPVGKQVINPFVISEPVDETITPAKEHSPALKEEENKYITNLIPENIPDDRNSIQEKDRTVLIVEDDTNFAKALQEYARSKGYKTVIAVRGDEAIELARQVNPIGILLDIQLPVKSGWDVMDELKRDSQTRHIPVHIMSAHEVKQESLLKGAIDFINKPVRPEKLQQVFQKIEDVLTRDPKKVLIIEENSKHANALAYYLETNKVNTEVKDNLTDGIHALKEQKVDCVILDMGIPAQGAYETLDEVKKTAGLENLPVIVFTGKSLSASEEMRIRQYADSIIVKTAHSYQRILDEVSIFLHLVEENTKKQSTTNQYRKLGVLNEVLKNKNVLIVDDDVRNIFSLTKALEKYKMNTVTAIDGKEALKQLKENPGIDIVLMDMMMPEMDGYETIRRIRQDAVLKHLPVIAVTAKAMTGDREKCINAGASDYITKPVDVDQLVSLLRVWLYEKGI